MIWARTGAQNHGGPHNVVHPADGLSFLQFGFQLFRGAGRGVGGRGNAFHVHDGGLLVVAGKLRVALELVQPRFQVGPHYFAGRAKLQAVGKQYGQRDHYFHSLGKSIRIRGLVVLYHNNNITQRGRSYTVPYNQYNTVSVLQYHYTG